MLGTYRVYIVTLKWWYWKFQYYGNKRNFANLTVKLIYVILNITKKKKKKKDGGLTGGRTSKLFYLGN